MRSWQLLAVSVVLSPCLSACSLKDYDYLRASRRSPTGADSERSQSIAAETTEPTITLAPSLENIPEPDAMPAPPVEPEHSVATAIPGEPEGNVLPNWSFEIPSLEVWDKQGNPTIRLTDQTARTGQLALEVSARNETWEGAAFDLTEYVAAGSDYEVSGWMWIRGFEGSAATMTVKSNCGGQQQFDRVDSVTASADQWVELSGTLPPLRCNDGTSTPTSPVLYFEGPPPGVAYYLDDVALIDLSLTADPEPLTMIETPDAGSLDSGPTTVLSPDAGAVDASPPANATAPDASVHDAVFATH